LAALATGACATAAAQAPRTDDDAFLDGLVGEWTLDGQVQGEPARSLGHGARVLGGAWVEFHMVDAAAPPDYEARIFIAVDRNRGDYIAHWLDTFGAPGARVVGAGHREGDALTIIYPYEGGVFRNIWTRQPDGGWTLSIDAQQTDGAWSNFASYTIRRAA
jgi:hypothetical protein